MSVGQFTREIGNGMMKQQAGAASEFIFTGYLKSWNSSSIYCSLLFLHLRNVMESAPHWDLGVLNSVHGSMPKESESKLGSQILGEYKWGDHKENDSASQKHSAGVLGYPKNVLASLLLTRSDNSLSFWGMSFVFWWTWYTVGIQ